MRTKCLNQTATTPTLGQRFPQQDRIDFVPHKTARFLLSPFSGNSPKQISQPHSSLLPQMQSEHLSTLRTVTQYDNCSSTNATVHIRPAKKEAGKKASPPLSQNRATEISDPQQTHHYFLWLSMTTLTTTFSPLHYTILSPTKKLGPSFESPNFL